MKRNPAHCGSQYQVPFPFLLSHQSDRWREYVTKEDFSGKLLVMVSQGLVRQSQELQKLRN